MRKCVVTGVAGFIGSNLAEHLLSLGDEVAGIDNFSTGKEKNIERLRASLKPQEQERFTLVRGDIRDAELCREACRGAAVVFHHAALVSVPLSVEQPRETFDINCGGFLNILQAARANGCRVIYASSSAVYGDHPELPKRETSPLAPLSPYGLAKMENEQWAALYWKQYGVPTIGFRYFNIYGPGQDPHGAYAAVIAAWSAAFRRGEKAIVYGDGTATRDFCFVGDVVQANVLAAGVEDARAFGSVFNIGSGRSVTLLQLFKALQHASDAPGAPLAFAPSRPGDILHSSADIERACAVLGYTPRFPLEEGLRLLLNAEQR